MYFISGIKSLDDVSGSKCVGYYTSKELAEIAVKENLSDIYENIYNYAVIENFGPGTHPECRERLFFKFDESSMKYIPTDEPEQSKHIERFAIN